VAVKSTFLIGLLPLDSLLNRELLSRDLEEHVLLLGLSPLNFLLNRELLSRDPEEHQRNFR